MADNVIIMGAGASADCGAPLMRQFFDKAAELHRQGVLGGIAADYDLVMRAMTELQRVNAKTALDLYNLESVWGAFEMAGITGRLGPLRGTEVEEAIPALKRLIVATVEGSTRFPVNQANSGQWGWGWLSGYDPMARALARAMREKTARRTSVLTFNYDIALEMSFLRAGVPFDYCLHPEIPPGHMPLCKLHGSIGWTQLQDGLIVPATLPKECPQDCALGQTTVHIHLGERLRQQAAGKGDGVAMIVPPTDSKLGHRRALAQVWRHAADQLAEASRVAIVGFSLPPTDEFFRSFFGVSTLSPKHLEKFMVFDPNKETAARLRDLLSGSAVSRFQWIEGPWSVQDSQLQAFLA